MMEYKGYHAAIKYDAEGEVLHGSVVGTRDMIIFEAASVKELKKEFKFSIDDYLAGCKESGLRPDKPFSGEISLKVSPDLHRAAAVAACARGKCLEDWIEEALEIAVSEVITNR